MKRILRTVLSVLLLLGAVLFAIPAFADDHPIRLTITPAPDTQLSTGGAVEYLTFTISNQSGSAYTLHRAQLSGGYENDVRAIDGEISIPANGTKEFTLYQVPVREEQLGKSVSYTLSWEEEATETDAEGNEQTISVSRSASAAVSIERFVVPELTIAVLVDVPHVVAGESFIVTYRISNDTKYDMGSIRLTDANYTGDIPLPAAELMAGASISVPITYTMGQEDMVFAPKLSYLAAYRPVETTLKAPVTVGSVVTGIQLDVMQYPANEEGTMFAITVRNTGNRSLRGLQLYDEINTPIEGTFDLGPQQQKVLSFTVPSAVAAGQVRRVQFHVTGKDFFQQPFSYQDPNTYECVPFVTSDAVRISLLASVTNAFLDENGKLCGTLQIEIRNYSDVRLSSAVLEELTLFGKVQEYDELQRGETYLTLTYQLDNVPSLSFRLSVTDPAGQAYYTEPVSVPLENLRAMATAHQDPTILYYSNTFLRQLTETISRSFRNVLLVVFILVLLGASMCTVLWFLEHRITSRLPRESVLSIRVPSKPAAQGAMDHVLAGSPAEQLGYVAPAKIRYSAPPEQPPKSPFGDLLFASRNRHAVRISDQTAAFAPFAAKRTAARKPAKPKKNAAPSVRIVEVQPLARRRALRPNEMIRMGSGRKA